MTKPTKPVIHNRDHEHGGPDPVRIVYESVGGGGSGGAGFATFALTGGPFLFDTDDTPVILDVTALGHAISFSTTDSATFDVSSDGRARILGPGMYVIGCQLVMKTDQDLTAQVDAYLLLEYAGGIGYNIEIPYTQSSFVGGSEQIVGTRFSFPATTTLGEDADVGVQRIHPISLTDATSFPFEIRPTFDTRTTANFAWRVRNFGLWGFRLSDPLGPDHSD